MGGRIPTTRMRISAVALPASERVLHVQSCGPRRPIEALLSASMAGQTQLVLMIQVDAMDHSDGGIAVIPD